VAKGNSSHTTLNQRVAGPRSRKLDVLRPGSLCGSNDCSISCETVAVERPICWSAWPARAA
jgi:hypothetical protein